MGNSSTAQSGHDSAVCVRMPDQDHLVRQGILRLLAIKDSDIRISTLEQCRDAVDHGMHSGGAFSAVIPLVSLFYGGFMDLDVAQPTKWGQDMFVLSKGHAVAPLASIYAELGYFDRAVLRDSRSYQSILNGHPGPILPGVHISTGPLGQGLSVAQGFALAGKTSPKFDVYCMVGDGELQEGVIWEAVMYSGYKRLDNLCVLVDQNNGQLDTVDRLVFPLPDLDSTFRAFGWHVQSVDATQYDGPFAALQKFKYGNRNGRPTAIICRTAKGYGGFSDVLNGHKAVISGALMDQELTLQADLRQARIDEFAKFYRSLDRQPQGGHLQEGFLQIAREMHISVASGSSGGLAITPVVGPVITRQAPRRDKQVRYEPDDLPRSDKSKQYLASSIITAAMKVFARDSRVVSIDSDLASISGLQAGIAAVDQARALNVGVAEANMMNIGEAYAVLGYNTWVSTFCPFFDWKVLRRIALGQQERTEAMEASDGWLSRGHGLDLTMLALSPDLEARTNGATHMGNDDITVFDGIPHLKIIAVSCPQQLLGVMKWIMEGNRGLVYLRVTRTPSRPLYDADFVFEFGKGYILRQSPEDMAVLISSSHGVYEALTAADECAQRGLKVGVVDMPSLDEALLLNLYDSGKTLCIAEQNNGYIWQNFRKILFQKRNRIETDRVVAINTLGEDGKPRFIHSGTYEQLMRAFSLAPSQLAETIRQKVTARPEHC
jgi:transketolase